MVSKPAKLILSSVLILFAVLISAYAFSYLRFTTTDFLRNKNAAITANIYWQILFYAHVAFGGIALLIGGFQFIEPLRDRFVTWHRRAGKVYVISVFVSAVSGFAIAIFADAGPVAKIGFGTLAVLWFFTNYRAYAAIRQGKILEHRSWMIRNYALTFAAVTLRIWLPIELAAIGMAFPDAYRLVAWLCWVPNLIAAEMLVYRLRAPLRVAA